MRPGGSAGAGRLVGLLLLAVGCLPPRPEKVMPRLGVVVAADAGKLVGIDFDHWTVAWEIGGFETPHGAVITPDGQEVYVASFDVDYLSVVDVETQRVDRTIEVGSTTHHLQTSADGAEIYVTLGWEGALAILARHTDEVLGRVPCGDAPFDVAVAPDGAAVYVTNQGSDEVSKVDLAGRSLVGNLAAGEGPTHVVVSPDSSRVFVTHTFSGTLTEIDAHSFSKVRDFEIGEDAHGLTISADGLRVFASGWSRRLVEVDLVSGTVRDLPVDSNDTHGLRLSPTFEHLLVCDIEDNRLIALDLETMAERAVISLPPSPHQLSFPVW